MSKLAHSYQPTMDEIEARRIADMDAEATQFAMELLMPAKLLLADLATAKIDIESGDGIARLAKKYRVSVPIMTARIAQLHADLERLSP